MKLWSKFVTLFRKEKLDAEMSEEMRLHLEQRTRENIARGLSPEDAGYAALRKFGGIEQAKEIARELRGVLWLEQLWQDSRHGVRGWARIPVLRSSRFSRSPSASVRTRRCSPL